VGIKGGKQQRTFGAEGDGDGIGELVNTLEHLVPAIIAKLDVLGVGPALGNKGGTHDGGAGGQGDRGRAEERGGSASRLGKHSITSN